MPTGRAPHPTDNPQHPVSPPTLPGIQDVLASMPSGHTQYPTGRAQYPIGQTPLPGIQHNVHQPQHGPISHVHSLYPNAMAIGQTLNSNIFAPTANDEDDSNIRRYININIKNRARRVAAQQKIFYLESIRPYPNATEECVFCRTQTPEGLRNLLTTNGRFSYPRFTHSDCEQLCAAANFSFDHYLAIHAIPNGMVPFIAKMAHTLVLPAHSRVGNNVKFQDGQGHNIDLGAFLKKMSTTIDVLNTHAIIFRVVLQAGTANIPTQTVPIVVYRGHGAIDYPGKERYIVVWGGNTRPNTDGNFALVSHDMMKLELCRLVAQVYEAWKGWANSAPDQPRLQHPSFDRHRRMPDFAFYEPSQGVHPDTKQSDLFAWKTMFQWMNHIPSLQELRYLPEQLRYSPEHDSYLPLEEPIHVAPPVIPQLPTLQNLVVWCNYLVRVLATYDVAGEEPGTPFDTLVVFRSGQVERTLQRGVSTRVYQMYTPPGQTGCFVRLAPLPPQILDAAFKLETEGDRQYLHLFDLYDQWSDAGITPFLPDVIHFNDVMYRRDPYQPKKWYPV